MMRSVIALLMSLSASVALAQVPATVLPAPQEAPWGAYTMATPVPYQPTMPAGIVPPPPVMTGATWQSYPNSDGGPNQAVLLDNVAPGVVPSVVPTDPGYPVTSEPDLKKSLTPPGARDGFFQKVDFDATWIPA